MSSDTDQSALKGNAIEGGLSAMWGLVLDRLVDKHAQAVAATRVNPEGGVARTPDGVVVTSKELYLQVLLNADDNYTNAGYQKRMEQSFGPIFLGMDWTPEYVKESTPANAAIGRVTRRDAFEVTLREARAALPSVPAPGGIVDRVNRDINAVIADAAIKAHLIELGAEPVQMTPAQFGTLIAEAAQKWAKVIKFANIKPE